MHLDANTWRALQERTLTEERARSVSAHLEEGCARCEELLVRLALRGEVDVLDGAVDEVLLALAPAADATRVDEIGFARIRDALRARAWRRRAVGAAGAAMAIAAVALFSISFGSTSPWRFKGGAAGEAQAPTLEVLQVRDGVPSPLARGARVPVGATLVFRVRLATPTCVQLWRGEARTEALLEQALCLDAGTHTLARDGEALGLQIERAGSVVLSIDAQPGAEEDHGTARAAPRSRFHIEAVAPTPAVEQR